MSRSQGPTLINLPPPPSDPGGGTPSDFGPGTPNSAFSTTAIKDGSLGQAPPHTHAHSTSSTSNSTANTLDAERADRISRLAGLERVATLRGANQHLAQGSQQGQQQQPPGYFDHGSYLHKSTVGSASATGSAGGRTTWTSGGDSDKMSEDQDDGLSSAGMSEEGNVSLVGFGETASSTGGPTSISNRTATTGKGAGRAGSPPSAKPHNRDSGSPMQGLED
ncbi:MAG: hypothetical protein ALECFALPRED_002726 [Alectoria fallacina]|uniref:Uncharacterized protein n=1 Tax=Alectoria fallacina TaxID=1903189 RepID=A0A8H3FIK9_9LECA|nr:MAG: hypothetical protein ALECFALPRED_002726 [Alectoria fallacina]